MVRKKQKSPNGSGSIWERPDGRYGAALTYPYRDPDTGRTKRRRATTTKRRWEDTHRWLMQMQSDRLGGYVAAPDEKGATVGQYLQEWLRDVVEPSVSRNTYAKREYSVRVHITPALGHVRLTNLEPRAVQALYSRLSRREPPYSLATRREVHVTLRMALAQAERWGMIRRNPADLVEPPRASRSRGGAQELDEDEGEVRALTDDQVRTLFAATTGKRWHQYYVAAVRTGLRPGEMLGLRWGDLNLEEDPGSLKVRRTLDTHGAPVFNPPKTEASRHTIALHWEAADSLKAQRDLLSAESLPVGPRDLVFPSTTGTPMSASNLLKRNLKPDLARAGLPELTLHELRHTFASIMLHEWRVYPDTVREMMGHDSIATTMRLYGHLFPGNQEQAIRELRRLHQPPENGTATGT